MSNYNSFEKLLSLTESKTIVYNSSVALLARLTV